MKNIIISSLLIVAAFSCTKREVIWDETATENYELSTIIKLEGQDCFLDINTSTLKYSIVESKLQNFSPTVIFQDYSEVWFRGNSLINNSQNDFGSLQLNTPYDIEIKTLNNTKKFKLVFVNTPLARVVTIDEIPNEPKIIGKLRVMYPHTYNPVNSFIGIEIRGKSTAGMEKKSYGFKPLNSQDLKDQASIGFFDMAPNTKWSLDAMQVDVSKVRNKTSFEIWNSLSNTSIKSQFIELFLNQQSLGFYRLSENYTETLLAMNRGSSLYVGYDNSDITYFNVLPKGKPSSGSWKGWEQEFPNPSEKVYWDDFFRLSQLIVEGGNQQFKEEIGEIIDLDNVMDYYLFMSLCYGYDNVGKNWFFFKKNPKDKFEILLWDLDATWGRNSWSSPLKYNKQISNNLFDRLIELNPDGFRTKLKNRWSILRQNQFSEIQLFQKFDVNFEEIINYNKYSSSLQPSNTYSRIETEQIYLKAWITNRLLFLDNYFTEL